MFTACPHLADCHPRGRCVRMTEPRGICPGETSVGCHSPGTIREEGRPAGVPCRSVMKPLGRDAREASMANARSRPVELVAESDLRFAEEDKAVLLIRLRAVTLLLSAGFVLVLARDLIFRGARTGGSRPPRRSPWPCWPRCSRPRGRPRAAAEVGRGRGLRPGGLRRRGPPLGAHPLRHGPQRRHRLKAAAKDAINGTTIVLFIYALLIPAPTGRAWRAIAAIAACPVATEMILFLVHPEVFRLARRVATLQSVGETVFFLLTVALLAGYGAYLANTMRVRARRGPPIQPVSPPGQDRGRGDGRSLPRRASVAEASLPPEGDPSGAGQ